MDGSRVISTIQTHEFDQRAEVVADVQRRIQDADRKVADLLQRSSATLDESTKKSVDAAIAEYNTAKQRVQRALEGTRSQERIAWERARASLATEFAFFVAAVAGIEVAAP